LLPSSPLNSPFSLFLTNTNLFTTSVHEAHCVYVTMHSNVALAIRVAQRLQFVYVLFVPVTRLLTAGIMQCRTIS
jgi:hypothetical protein